MHWRKNRLPTPVLSGFPWGSAGKESTCNMGDLGLIPGLGRSPGEGKTYVLQYSGLENSMDCIVYGVTKSQTWLSHLHIHFTVIRVPLIFFSPSVCYFELFCCFSVNAIIMWIPFWAVQKNNLLLKRIPKEPIFWKESICIWQLYMVNYMKRCFLNIQITLHLSMYII